MSKKKEPKIPQRVTKVIDRCRSGETLCRGYRPRAIGDERDVLLWWFEPSGKTCGPASAEQAIKIGALVPCDAGLFADGNAQSFRVAP